MTAGRRRKGGGGPLVRGLLLFLLGAGAGVLGYRQLQKGEVRPTPPPQPAPTEAPATRSSRPTPARGPLPTGPKRVPVDFEAAGGEGKGVVAVVLDDLGHADGSLARLGSWDGPLAVAVLPDAPLAGEAAALAKRKGWDLLVHLPMEPLSGRAEPHSVGSADDDATIGRAVEAALAKVPGAVGLNNHQGSKATADPRVMRALLTVVRDRGLLFLDSRTSAATVAAAEAKRLGLSTVVRDVFLDDAKTESATEGGTPVALAEAWEKVLETALRKGSCVVIGHPHPETLDFLSAHLPELGKKGLHFFFLFYLA